MKKKRVLLVSCSVIMLCICIIAGMSYALFSDSVSVKNHLQAGNLDVTLKRTNLKYSVLNDDGELEEVTVTGDLDLTSSTDENVFGINSSDIRIVPGSYFDADFKISNNGNTAFDYSIQIKFIQGDTALSEQLKVIVSHPDGSTTEKKLSELSGGLSVAAGKMKPTDAVQTFGVRVEFVDNTDVNNAAQSGSAVFDLIVTATQATADGN